MTRLLGIGIESLDNYWPESKKYIQKALLADGERFTLESIYQGIVSRDLQLWVAEGSEIKAICITEIQKLPKTTVCLLFLCGGTDHKEWVGHIKPIERWAKSQGCNEMEIVGRKGWGRVLEGYKEIKTILGKPL